MGAAVNCGNLCDPLRIPGAGWAVPTYTDNPESPSGVGIDWSFSFEAYYKGQLLSSAALAETLGLPAASGGQVPTVGGIPGIIARSPSVDIKCNGKREVANVSIGGPMVGAGDVVDISSPKITVSSVESPDDIFLYSNPRPAWGLPGSKHLAYDWTLMFGAYNPGEIKWTFTVTSKVSDPFMLVARTSVTCGKAPVQ